MNLGHLLTAATIRCALLCYVAAVAIGLSRREVATHQLATTNSNRPIGWRWQRTIWTVGCIFFIAHVAAAFQFYHHWSHRAAFENTLMQTKELMGWGFGYGIYFSYAFLLLWIVDAIFWWRRGELYVTSPGWWSVPLHLFLAFIAFNGTVVFKGGLIRAAGIVATILLSALWIRRTRSTAKRTAPSAQISPPLKSIVHSPPDGETRYE